MKMRKLAAYLAAVAIALTSMSVAAFADPPEEEETTTATEAVAETTTTAAEVAAETTTGEAAEPGETTTAAAADPEATTTAAPATEAPAAPSVGGGHLVSAPSAAATEAPVAVTAANGEAVEAAKDVIPEGAALEVKEQSKEDAVKAIEAVKATDANKEVVETVKKAVEDGKAAVVDIDLVKDGAEVQPNGTVKVTVSVPAALKDAASVFVYRVEADGTFTDVKAEVKDGKVSFSTKHFSTYIFTAEALTGDAVAAENAEATTAAAAAPANNDDKAAPTGVAFAVVPTILAATGIIVSKKRNK